MIAVYWPIHRVTDSTLLPTLQQPKQKHSAKLQ